LKKEKRKGKRRSQSTKMFIPQGCKLTEKENSDLLGTRWGTWREI